jgi:hypothetical protein
MVRLLRKEIRGWRKSIDAEMKRKKASLLYEIYMLDLLTEQQRDRRKVLCMELYFI